MDVVQDAFFETVGTDRFEFESEQLSAPSCLGDAQNPVLSVQADSHPVSSCDDHMRIIGSYKFVFNF